MLLSLLSTSAATLIALFALPGGISTAIGAFRSAITAHSTGPTLSYMADSVSSPASIWKVARLIDVEFVQSWIEESPEQTLFCLGVLCFLAVALISLCPIVDTRMKILLAMSTTQLIVPLSGLYTPLWIVMCLPLIASFLAQWNRSGSLFLDFGQLIFILGSMVSLVPLPFSISSGEFEFRLVTMAGPTLMTIGLAGGVIGVCCLVFCRWRRTLQTSRRSSLPSEHL